MVTKTGFKGALTKDITERITLKDILKKEREMKRMKAIIKYKASKKK